MFIFPKNRHQRTPLSYRFNVGFILLAFFNIMAYPAYGEIERMMEQRQLEARLINEVSSQQDLAATLDEIKTLLTAINPQVQSTEQAEAFTLFANSDPILKQGEDKQRQRLQNLIAVLPERYNDMVSTLQDSKADLLLKKENTLSPIIDALDEQLAAMADNYQRLMLALSPPDATDKDIDITSALALLNRMSTSPRQQRGTGPSQIPLTESNRIYSKARTTDIEFSAEKTISNEQLALADTIKITQFKSLKLQKMAAPLYRSLLADSDKYLGEGDEVQLTQRIKDKAAELNYNPVEIYYWVRNNIEFIPTWGAYQTAEHTLGSLQGNAFDTATLLIALLRASNIPARYVQGTISIEPTRFTNWMGDFKDATAAGSYAANGGMRITKLLAADKKTISSMQIEHVWVEAAIDFFPSRGMQNHVADTWLPMDASFKQYEYLEGLDVETIGGIDSEKLLQDFGASGTSNETEGWVQNLDSNIIETAQQDAQNQLEAHIKTLTDPTVGDVLGGNKVIVKEYPMLSAGLENPIIVRGTDYVNVPNQYQAQIGLAMQSVLSNGIVNVQQPSITPYLKYYPFAKFNSEKTLLRFTPATQADKDALAALVPANATSVDDLPKFIGSGIQVIPELVLDGEVVLTGEVMAIGREVRLGYQPRLPNVRNSQGTMTYDVIAGSYLHIPIVGYSVNAFNLSDTQKRVEATQKILESKDQSQMSKLTREDILGDLFYTGGLGYYAQLNTMNQMLSQQGQGIGRVLVGLGSYGYEPKLRQAGILATPVGIELGSISTNIRNTYISQSKDNSLSNKQDIIKNTDFAMGMNGSILESTISEQLFCNKAINPNSNPCYGISTVSGLQKAAAQGQKIYQINRDNKDQLSNITMSDENMANDINTAINGGGYVIVPERAVDGTGKDAIYVYMTYTGNGNQYWKISGGLNGGYFASGFFLATIFVFSLYVIETVMKTPFEGTIAIAHQWLIGTATLLLSYALMTAYLYHEFWYEEEKKCFWGGFMTGLLSLSLVGGKKSKVFQAVGAIMSALSGFGIVFRQNDLKACLQ